MSAGAAQASCPVAGDLSRGIALHTSGAAPGYVDIYYGAAPGIVSFFAVEDGRVTYQETDAHGLYILTSLDLYDGPLNTDSYTYPGGLAELPKPAPGVDWSATVRRSANGETSTARHSYAFADPTALAIGACTYAAIPADVRVDGDDGPISHAIMYYLPELEISVLYATDIEGEMNVIFQSDRIGYADELAARPGR
ncbi:hypothetical protein DL237_15190 [Pseudooceanicola sediminis]|uniref:Uncharacterized protein n=1 Tax=Pseudooceanicola sediminis TaxID=2211117 RepID=A0A399IZ71_9RHOB|nr:hypothetical protein DL237_15190 [Pseudooceanicola sediminis]